MLSRFGQQRTLRDTALGVPAEQVAVRYALRAGEADTTRLGRAVHLHAERVAEPETGLQLREDVVLNALRPQHGIQRPAAVVGDRLLEFAELDTSEPSTSGIGQRSSPTGFRGARDAVNRGGGHLVEDADQTPVPIRAVVSGVLHRVRGNHQITIRGRAHVRGGSNDIGAAGDTRSLHDLPERPVRLENRVELVWPEQIRDPQVRSGATEGRNAVQIVQIHTGSTRVVCREMSQRPSREAVEHVADLPANGLDLLLGLELELIHQHRAGALLLGDVLRGLRDGESCVEQDPDQRCGDRSRTGRPGFFPTFRDRGHVDVIVEVQFHRDFTSGPINIEILQLHEEIPFLDSEAECFHHADLDLTP